MDQEPVCEHDRLAAVQRLTGPTLDLDRVEWFTIRELSRTYGNNRSGNEQLSHSHRSGIPEIVVRYKLTPQYNIVKTVRLDLGYNCKPIKTWTDFNLKTTLLP